MGDVFPKNENFMVVTLYATKNFSVSVSVKGYKQEFWMAKINLLDPVILLDPYQKSLINAPLFS